MQLNHKLEKTVCVVQPDVDSLDGTNARLFARELDSYIQKYDLLLLDLSEVDYIDSAGISSLIQCQRAVENRRAHMAILARSKQVLDLFHLIRMDDIVDIVDSRDEGIAALQAHSTR